MIFKVLLGLAAGGGIGYALNFISTRIGST